MTKGIIVLPESLDISEVNHWHQNFISLVNEHDEIEVDDSKLENIDTAGAQLLIALARELRATNKKLLWSTPSAIVEKCLSQLGASNVIVN